MMSKSSDQTLMSSSASGLQGAVRCPGDKSISHRALLFGALATGPTRIDGMLEGDDVLRTAQAVKALGASVERSGSPEQGVWTVHGCGVGGLREPESVLDMGNSGTGARLLLGVLSAHPFSAVVAGDESLSRRPMDRVTIPLSRMGAAFTGRAGGLMPLTVRGTGNPIPLVYESPVASAQVKSAVLLAGLHARGQTTVIEPAPTRDHTERMLRYFGAAVETAAVDGNPQASLVTVRGLPELTGQNIVVPGDPSSAAFLIVAALITDGSDITIENVGLNPLRTGLVTTLKEMGADIVVVNEREEAGEPVGDLRVRSSKLKGTIVPAERAPSMIDEYPVLAVAAACAAGETRMEGLAELRVKESDRLAAIADGLAACGVTAVVDGDSLTVQSNASPVPGGATVSTHFDHRIAMSFLVLGTVADKPICVDDGRAIATSYPDFVNHMTALGANLAQVEKTIQSQAK